MTKTEFIKSEIAKLFPNVPDNELEFDTAIVCEFLDNLSDEKDVSLREIRENIQIYYTEIKPIEEL